MRLWSIHPKYLDRAGLVACWREGLLAKKVLEGNTKGYKNHPQLLRFKEFKNPNLAMDAYLTSIFEEAKNRGYKFNPSKIKNIKKTKIIKLTCGQLKFEFNHLKNKLKIRDFVRYSNLNNIDDIEENKIFDIIPGDLEKWEKIIF